MVKTQKPTSEKIGGIVHDAIIFAHNDYKELSHGNWLRTGAEYYLTVTIAHRLFEELNGEYPVLVEYPIYGNTELVSLVGEEGPKELPGGGRVDCVLFDKYEKWKPAATIEVKTYVHPADVESDINRLIAILSHATCDFPGMLAYWSSAGKGSESKMREHSSNLDDRVDSLIAKHNKDKSKSMRVKRSRTFDTIRKDNKSAPDAYLAYCAVIERA